MSGHAPENWRDDPLENTPPVRGAFPRHPRPRPALESATAEKIAGFADLPAGWHYGTGSPAGTETVRLALLAETMLRRAGYSGTDAFFSADGEIKVTGYLDRRCVSIEVSDDGAY